MLAGCSGSKDENRQFPVAVQDAAGLLSPTTKRELRTATYPKGLPFAVRTTGRVPVGKLARAADDAFDVAARTSVAKETFEKRGVLVFVTTNPRLIQMRVGSDLYLPAQRASLTWGPEYLAHQQVRSGHFNPAVRQFMRRARAGLVTAPGGWRARLTNNVLYKPIAKEIQAITRPSDGFYGNNVESSCLSRRRKVGRNAQHHLSDSRFGRSTFVRVGRHR
jgi:hypothetical protein